VEAASPSISDLGTAVNSAVSVLGAGYVSNSYGAPESSSEGTGSGCSAFEAKPSWQTDSGWLQADRQRRFL
jgi:hypothetical protein